MASRPQRSKSNRSGGNSNRSRRKNQNQREEEFGIRPLRNQRQGVEPTTFDYDDE